VRSFSAADGGRRWLAVVPGRITASAVLAGGRILVPSAAGVTALDVGDGHEVWKVPGAYGCQAAPAVVGRRAYVSLRNHGVLVLDVHDGTQIAEKKFAPQGALLADTDLLVVGGEDGELRSLDPATAKERWRVDLGGAPVMGPTLAAPGVVVVMAKDRTIQALRTSDGSVLWTVRSSFLSPSESISSAAGRVFLTDTSGFLRAYDAATGRELWNRNEGFVTMGAPAATPDAVCFGARGRLGCRDAKSGDFLWRIDVDRRDSASPVAAAGRIFVLDAGQLRCLK
jgi:outer membrane protein assembly factor BamB